MLVSECIATSNTSMHVCDWEYIHKISECRNYLLVSALISIILGGYCTTEKMSSQLLCEI